jgi:hypothetical protein
MVFLSDFDKGPIGLAREGRKVSNLPPFPPTIGPEVRRQEVGG